MPALISGTQALGEPRYPSLKGIMAARSKEITTLSLADLGIEPATVGLTGATTKVVDSRPPETRGATRVVRDAPEEAAHRSRTSWPSGGSSDGRHLGPWRDRRRRIAREADHRGRHARPDRGWTERWCRGDRCRDRARPDRRGCGARPIRPEGPRRHGADDGRSRGRDDRRAASRIADRDPRSRHRDDRCWTRGSRSGRCAIGTHRVGRAGQRDRGPRIRGRSGGDPQRLRRQAHHRERLERR